MITLLCEANPLTASARQQGLEALPGAEVERLQNRYETVLETAAQRNRPRPPPPGSRRRFMQSPPPSLIQRPRAKRDDVLRFITDLRVPFDSNLAERDIRMHKLKRKMSSGFRNDSGIALFATIRSYLSTMRQQGADIFKAHVLTFQGSSLCQDRHYRHQGSPLQRT